MNFPIYSISLQRLYSFFVCLGLRTKDEYIRGRLEALPAFVPPQGGATMQNFRARFSSPAFDNLSSYELLTVFPHFGYF